MIVRKIMSLLLFRPPLNWKEHQGKRFTTLPEAGQVFGIEFGSDGLYRAVRNDFIKKV